MGNLTLTEPKLQNPSHYQFEKVPCYYCGSTEEEFLLVGQDDLTGKPGNFRYVTCKKCGLAFQNPRIKASQIGEFYDNEYIAHRKKKDFGVFTPLYNRAMGKHDRDKCKLVQTHVELSVASEAIDIGCAVGTYLIELNHRTKCKVTGVDFKDLKGYPGSDVIDFRCGLFVEQDFGGKKFDLITMWHYLEHDYDPVKTIKKAREILKDDGRMIIEVPCLDSLTYSLYAERWPGVQAPQHTVMFDKEHLVGMIEKNGFEVIHYQPWGAFPPFFYIFMGAAFKKLKGKGINLDKIVVPYFLLQILFLPLILLFGKMNISMQTVVCRKKD